MKTYTKLMLMLSLFVFGAVQQAYAVEEDPITVTFRVNTSTVADTLSGDGAIQLRGAVNGEEFDDEGYFGQNVNWGSSSIQATHVAGDYWELNLQMAPGDELTYKFRAFHDLEGDVGAGFNDGWEADAAGGGNYSFTVPEDATEDITTEILYFAGLNAPRQAPFEPSDEGMRAVHFRVDVGARVATGQYDPEDEDQVVGVRGDYNPETGRIAYKFVIDTPAGIQWEDGADKEVFLPAADSTLHWGYFNNEVPPTGEVITADVEFRANVGLLEALGYFNRGIGDQVAIPGAFNSWDSGTPMTFDEGEDIWRSTFELSREVGSTVPYKYFIIWDESRFDEDSENYIPNLVADNGWEEPGSFGGGDRLYEFGSSEFQIATGDFGGDVGFFNSLPEQALITEDGTGSSTYPVTFELDMTEALTADVPFNPEASDVFLVVETPIFALTQGIPTGTAALDDPETREKLTFTRVGDTNNYELTLDLMLPTENHFGFVIGYEDADGQIVTNGGGFDAGRRYYRYVEPEAVFDDLTIWPAGGFTLDPITWIEEDLDFPEPPTYGLGDEDRPVLLSDNPLDGFQTTFPLTREVQPENANHFYSGTIYLSTEPTSISGPGSGELPRQITLNQNYPNPFNPTTNIDFSLPEQADIRLDVYNVLGQRVATLANGSFSAGTHTVQFDASRLSSGVYLYRLQSGSFVTQKSMMLVK